LCHTNREKAGVGDRHDKYKHNNTAATNHTAGTDMDEESIFFCGVKHQDFFIHISEI